MLYVIIMAGGQGTRLWPESRKERPKQFLALKDGRPLILDAAESLGGLVAREQVFVVTGETMVPLVQESIPWLPEQNIIVEPVGRNTSPCLGLAAIHLMRHDPDATMVVLSADHWNEPHSVFCDTVRFAVDLVDESPERLVTLAVRPTCASTSYGYIERAEKINSHACQKWSHFANAYQVSRFHEKPDRQTAGKFVEFGDFGWNAGIFIWKARRIFDLIAKYQPKMGCLLAKIATAIGTETYKSVLAQEFPQMQAISIDYAVLEKADSLVCIDAPFRWDDVGTWQALDRIHRGKHDSAGNLIETARVVAVNSHNNIVRGSDPQKNIVLVGVDNLIVVQSEHGTLIADKSQEEAIRQAIAELNQDT